ncbi:LON peptidase N-terminal domain and ring finger 1, like isoform X2 [Engraulis encrasicolus]|uniref:LON peptidase N-terminal domain and ring finger 1, like isoform X2 n=1 Tax=Engraulis encrasicolus TaxID=184585 RepID=UPI002FD2CEDD
MALQTPEERSPLKEKRGFFIAPESDLDWDEDDDHVDHQRLILLKADAFASENRVKEAIDSFSMALRYGSVRPEQLGTLVECILRNYKKKVEEETPSILANPDQTGAEDDVFICPGCHRFIGEAVTVICGHSYCRRCLQLGLFSKCKVCNEDLRKRLGLLRSNVILSGLVEKCFADEMQRSRKITETECLIRRKQFEEGLALANGLIDTDPGDVRVRASRADAFVGLGQHLKALDDLEICLTSAPSPEAYYRKAKVLQEMGQVDESLQVFLHCLALDESYGQAKHEVEMILHSLLSPVSDSVKVGLRETALNGSPHLRSKTQALERNPQKSPPHTHTQGQQEVQSSPQRQALPRAASAHPHLGPVEKVSRSESLERLGLGRAHSLRTHGLGGIGEEGLKRVYSAPQLGDQEKGSLLKRKLSVSDVGQIVVYSGGNKHKKQGVTTSAGSSSVSLRTITRDLLDPSDFECSLCMRLFFEPVTTPCGHTFCKNCLERCLDHTPQCPLCKESLKEYLSCRKYNVTSVLDRVIKEYFAEEHKEREKTHADETQELSDLTKNVPMFVCTMAYPTVPCPLHVFEPRYRLMIRRCMDTGTRQFGMCISDSQKGFVDYGCMLLIRSVHFLPDGRSVVDTIGGKRFRVLSRGMKDGYCIADIEYLEDTKVNNEEELLNLQELHDQLYEQARTWFQNLKTRFRNQILQHFGPMPEREADIQATPNGPACCWWLLAVLPVDPRYQLSVLSMTTLRERLLKMQHILTYLQSIPNE